MAVLATNPHILFREIYSHDHHQQPAGICSVSVYGMPFSINSTLGSERKRISRRDLKAEAFWQGVTEPTVVELEPIKGTDQLDQILLQAQDLSQPIIIDWMANWCRKCIYLKPKLEKLASEYHTKIKFYYVDVNNVSQALVKRGNISKMPTIQLWKDGEMKEEVIGGHKAWLVVDEVREMIKKYV